jgi:uncharacterized membrane protein YphA (DoxX/SURF4 family)
MNSTFTKLLRVVLALGLIAFGLNKFLGFIPAPDLPEQARNFINSLNAPSYALPIVGSIKIFIGLLLLANKAVPFALLLLVPIMLNVLLFHLFLDLSQIWVALLITIATILLIYKHWKVYKPLF